MITVYHFLVFSFYPFLHSTANLTFLGQNQKWFCCSSHGSAAEPVPWSGSTAEPWLGKRRRFFENHHDKKKRKARDAARRNQKRTKNQNHGSAAEPSHGSAAEPNHGTGSAEWLCTQNHSAERFCTVEPILQCRTDSAESPILQNGGGEANEESSGGLEKSNWTTDRCEELHPLSASVRRRAEAAMIWVKELTSRESIDGVF
ncbi:30S ribosomal protein S21, chloroplastic-like [Senna tora]|uniref:30S ribosomal protein S21, chloroplastic-like n=1 Tax=Senna tora TaxID=362788 RepID=A0A834SVF2_9FABA|nr:30S ribosomal protein S21, chloroplastic-like [Senna tora]